MCQRYTFKSLLGQEGTEEDMEGAHIHLPPVKGLKTLTHPRASLPQKSYLTYPDSYTTFLLGNKGSVNRG